MSQSWPCQPSWQRHWKEFTPSMHVPPFPQGSLMQSLISEKKNSKSLAPDLVAFDSQCFFWDNFIVGMILKQKSGRTLMTVDSAEARITCTGEVACWLTDAAPSGTADIGGDMPHSSWIVGCYSNCTAVNDCRGGRNKQRKVQIHDLLLEVPVGSVLFRHCGRTSPWHGAVWQFSFSRSQVFPSKPSGHAQ